MLLSLPWKYVALLTGVLQLFHILFFSGLYLWVSDPHSKECNLNSANEELPFEATFGFSLITMSTIGYTTLDNTPAFFNSCALMTFLVYLQTITFITLDGFLINLFYQRLERADPRANRVIFSKKAIVRFEDGKVYFVCQIYDLEKKVPLIECHARFYVIQNSKISDSVETVSMRVSTPSDDIGGVLFLALPSQVQHEIDVFSPLYPKDFIDQVLEERKDDFAIGPRNVKTYPGIMCKSTNLSRFNAQCPACGFDYINEVALAAHIKYQSLLERSDRPLPMRQQTFDISKIEDIDEIQLSKGKTQINLRENKDITSKVLKRFQANHLKRGGGHIDLQPKNIFTSLKVVRESERNRLLVDGKDEELEFVRSQKAFKLNLQKHLQEKNIEIVVLIEAIEPGASGTFQAKSSYKLEDIEFDCVFKESVTRKKGKIVVDLNAFNELDRELA